jgi:serine/threonine protein kinase
MTDVDHRWWGPRSDYPWEEDALRHIRGQMPSAEPYRGWQTFTFTAQSGHIREVDLFIATPAGLFLIEIKSHPGRAVNQGGTWLFKQDDHVRAIENPLHLTNRKCQELKSQLGWAAGKLGLGTRLPFIQAAVFLSAPDLRCDFDEVQRTMVFARDGLTEQTGLPGIWAGLLGQPPRSASSRVDPALSRQLEKLLQKIGVRGLRKHRKIGPFQLAPRAFDTGPTWEDYLAENPALPGDQVRRIRIYLSDLNAPKTERDSAWRAARREYLALQGISHQGIVQAEQFSEEHEAGPAIIFRHGATWQRLDQFMAEQGAGSAAGAGGTQQGTGLPIETRIEMVRQLAEALDHAHRRHLYHRALAARSVYVEMDGRYPRLRICDWQVAARPGSGTSGPHTLLTSGTPTSLAAHIDPASGPYLAPEFGNPESDATQLDVFGLGALTHLILTGVPPAGSLKELAIRLAAERALVPSAMCDEISPAMDDLVRSATGAQPVDRFESVRDFLAYLDLVEAELTRPDQDEIPDLLTAAKGTVVDGWQVGQILGKGSTARALLMTRDGDKRVYKVALSDAGRTRLAHEAAQLKNLRDSHIVRLINGPKDIGDRTVLILEQAGEQTLGQYLRHEGRLAIGDLETLGDHLFQAIGYLEGEGIWHRDIKPDNLAIRELNKKGRRLVLFDFSLADAANRATEAGTQHYLDPFLGTDRRPEYDAAAERYAVAVTLHEMASGELPSWGDGMVEARLLDPSEQLPQLAEDSFDPQLRDRLVAFFDTALQRDPARRYASLKDMSRAWFDVFRALDERRPATTPETVGELPVSPADARQVSAARVAASTPLVAAGLSARALSAAEQQLDVSTVGELIKIPAARVQRLRGVGRGPRNELLKRAREWRQQLQVTEQLPDAAMAGAAGQGSIAGATGTPGTAASQARAGPALAAAVAADPATLSLDEITGRLVPRDNGKNAAEIRVIRLLLALPDAEGHPSPVLAWAPQAAVAAETGLSQPYVGSLLGKARERWTKSVKPVTELRKTVLEILARRGRVMEVGQLAAALLAERGSGLDDPVVRIALAQACLRAAIEAEEHLDNPRLARRRTGTRLLIAAVATAEDDPTTPIDDPTAPTEEELLDYAVDLGRRADELVDLRDASPLPGTTAVLEALADVTRPDGMPPLSDTDLVSLAAGASQNAAMTARLELYPRSLDPKKALRLAQAASYLGNHGLEPDKLRQRVLARFPELANLPDPGQLRKLLQDMGHIVNLTRDEAGITRYVIPGGTLAGSWSSTRGPTSMAGYAQASAIAETRQRLLAAAEHGGFLAITTRLAETAPVREELTALADVSPVNVTEVFLTTLREIVRERGKPRWESVLAADAADATPAARAGFGRLLDAVWERLDKQVRAMPGTVILHDATPLARYAGGTQLLSRLAAGARQADEAPHGLWLLCPMDDPRKPARLDEQTVATLGENEQLVVRPADPTSTTRRAS